MAQSDNDPDLDLLGKLIPNRRRTRGIVRTFTIVGQVTQANQRARVIRMPVIFGRSRRR